MNREIYNTFWTRILEKGFRKDCEENNFALWNKKAFWKIIFFPSLRKIKSWELNFLREGRGGVNEVPPTYTKLWHHMPMGFNNTWGAYSRYLLFKIHIFCMKPRQKDQSRLVTNQLRPGPVKTGLVTAKRPRLTTADWSLVVQSSFLRFLDLQGPVSVLVQASQGKRLDWTGLSNTIIYHNLSFLELPLLHMLPFFLSNFDVSM